MTDIIHEAFSGDLEFVGSQDVRLVQSQNEKRVRLMTGKSELIDLACQAVQTKMASLADVIYVYQYVLAKIASDKVNEDGKILDGRVDFDCTIGSFRSRRKTRIAISFPIIMGKLRDTVKFTTVTGQDYLLNKDAVKKVLGVKDPDTQIMKHRDGFMKSMQWSARYPI